MLNGSIEELGCQSIGTEWVSRSIVILLLLGSASGGESPGATGARSSGTASLQRALENVYAENCLEIVELTVSSGNGSEAKRTLQIIRSQRKPLGRSLIRFIKPADIRSISILINEKESGAADVFLYLPAERRIRRASGAQRGDAFFGTNLTFEDVEGKHIEDFNVVDERISGTGDSLIILDVEPTDTAYSSYTGLHFCVDSEKGILHWVKYLNNGRLIKELVVDQGAIREVDGRFIPTVMEMRSVKDRVTTHIQIKEYVRLRDIPEVVFSQRNLESGDGESDRRKLGIQ